MAWHSVKDAATLIEVSVDTVYALCASGRLVHRRVGARGGRIRISDTAIETYLKSCEVGPANCPGAKAEATWRPLPSRPARRAGPLIRPDGKPVRGLWK